MHFLSWFEGVFEATSDKARLVTVLLSAIVAISIVLINQSLTKRRDRLALKATKIEELYMSTINFINAVSRASDAISKLNQLAISEQKDHKIEIEKNNESYTKIFDLVKLHAENALEAFQKIHLIKNLYMREIYLPRKLQLEVSRILNDLADSSYKDDESKVIYLNNLNQLYNYSRLVTSRCVKLSERNLTTYHKLRMMIKRFKQGPDMSDSMAKYPD